MATSERVTTVRNIGRAASPGHTKRSVSTIPTTTIIARYDP